jgi:hypothetical protein
MGSSFYLGWLIPRETSLVIWGSEGEGSRFKASKGKDRLPFIDYCQYDSQKKKSIPLEGTCLRDKTDKARKCAAVVSTSQFNDYL